MKSKRTPNWVGPVAAAVILVVGYVGYNEWEDREDHTKECARLAALFENNLNSMMESGAIEEAQRIGNQLPMASLSDDVEANGEIMKRLDTECPDWKSKHL